jgi:hypothetical protein
MASAREGIGRAATASLVRRRPIRPSSCLDEGLVTTVSSSGSGALDVPGASSRVSAAPPGTADRPAGSRPLAERIWCTLISPKRPTDVVRGRLHGGTSADPRTYGAFRSTVAARTSIRLHSPRPARRLDPCTTSPRRTDRHARRNLSRWRPDPVPTAPPPPRRAPWRCSWSASARRSAATPAHRCRRRSSHPAARTRPRGGTCCT